LDEADELRMTNPAEAIMKPLDCCLLCCASYVEV